MTRWAFLDHDGPLAFAHRGGALDAPENSLQAFREAAELGYRYVETDVRCTADGALLAFHDDRLDRVTDHRGRIADLTLAQIRTARIDGVAPIPLLEELLEELPTLRVNIDPKDDRSVEPLAALIDRMGAVDRVCISSFSNRRVAQAAGLLGTRLCTGMGRRSVARLWTGIALRSPTSVPEPCAQVPLRFGAIPVATRRFIDRAHRLDKVVHAWVVDDPAEMQRLLDLGIDGIMTDRPAVLRDVLRARGQWAD